MERTEQRATDSPSASTPAAEDIQLVTAVRRKDRKATGEFVRRHADSIYRYLYSRLSPRTDLVDDLVQEVFLAAWKSLDLYHGDSSLRAWLLGIARHKVEDHYRSMLREAVPLDEVGADTIPHSGDREIELALDRGRLQERTRRVMAELPDVYRTALLWRYWEKSSSREMAAKTGRTEKAIERLLARARNMFRKKWNDE